jgi:hypothetical protein
MDVGRWLVAIWRGVRAFLGALWRSVTQLFHQITGVFFLLFSVVGASALVREWRRWPASKLAVAGVFTAIFTWFTVESFLRARKA